MAKKNPYLSKPKEGISAQQKALRQHPGQDVNPPPLSKRLEADDEDDFPSIDGETVETQDGLRERKYKSKFDYFNNDAEESLRFFKKNLLPPSTSASAQVEASPPSPARQSRSTGLQQKPTGSPLESQPSMGSTRGELAHFARLHAPAATSTTSRASVMTTNLNNNDYKSAPFRDSSKSELRSSRYKPTLQSPSDGESNAESIQARTRAATTAPSRVGADNPAYADQNLPNQSLKSRPRIAGERQQSAPRHLSGDSKAADQVELAKPIKTSNSKISESPVPPEAFARKPLYNSLLRAHDSIRLKVNRPKVRPKSETAQVEDTEVDDSIKLPEMVDAPDQLNERAVDVKRRSSRKKNTKKEVKADKKAADDSMAPVRNFSEVRVVKVVRTDTERSLGVTVRAEDGNIIVARILAGSLADKQGALQVGDVILAVNDREVYTPEQLQEQLRQSSQEDIVLLKIVPSFREELPTLCIYLRALFNHDPNEDSLLPCKEVGVSFNQGDILEVVNQEDPNWWQARRVDSENLQTGLIPSQELEERRRAFVIPDYDLATRTSICGTKVSRKSKKKEIYNVGQNCDFDRAELQLYEEVCRTPAFERRTLVLIGANGVGKQALKAKLIALDPDRFGTPLPHTSRLARDGEEDGIHYLFVTREKMEEDIMAGKYLEYGEYDGALYGTKLDSVREIIGSGKVCVLDCSPTCLKVLKTSDYLPFVAFIAAPTLDQLRYMHDWNRGNKTYATFDRALSRQSRRAKTLQDFAFDFFEDEDLQVTIEESARLFRIYENYFDIVLVNNDFNRTFEALRDAIDALSMAPQWIPISWIYGT